MQKLDEDISLKIAKGDVNAFKQIYALYYAQLCKFAWRYTQCDQQAEDIVQESMVKLWEQKERFTEVSNLKAYLFLSVKNACINYLEHQKVVAKHADVVVAEINLLSLQEDNLESELEREQLEARVFEAIEGLPAQSGEVFKMKYLEGKRTKEIAEMLGLSPRTVETHVYNALKSLRSIFN